eukprot:14085553-Alexandrium_andersonii.AAC.1
MPELPAHPGDQPWTPTGGRQARRGPPPTPRAYCRGSSPGKTVPGRQRSLSDGKDAPASPRTSSGTPTMQRHPVSTAF